VTESPRFSRSTGSAAGVVDGQTVVVSPTDLRYHALNTTAAAVWELLADGTTVDQAVERLVLDFEVDEPTCRSDVETCLAHFVSIGIAEQSGASST
jgi:Coenzyme PQQ synthesis protein D (PqqD)